MSEQTPFPSTDLELAEQRAGFAASQVRELPVDVVVTDGSLGGVPTKDVSIAAAPADRVLFYLHGGGYVVGSATTGVPLAMQLARRVGARAVSVDYRLAPENPFPAALDDAVAAYRALLESGVAAADVLVTGESAGGGLTMSMLVAARDAGLPMPAAAYVMSPFADLSVSGESVRTLEKIDPLFTHDLLANFASGYAPGERANDPLASPVFADLSGLPPLLIHVGGRELLLDDATRLASRAGAGGVAVTLQVWPGMTHVFQNSAAPLPDAVAALDAGGAFLRAHCPAPS